MRILVVNDDGIQAEGLKTLVSRLSGRHEVYVCAPAEERSCSSRALTFLNRDLQVVRAAVPGAEEAWVIEGTPADCAYLAIHVLMDRKPDLLISGINSGQNLSSDCIYSGTIGAASEGLAAGIPAVAVSLCLKDRTSDYQTAADIAVKTAEYFMQMEENEGFVLNVNIPDLPQEKIRGFRITSFAGDHEYDNRFEKNTGKDGKTTLHCTSREVDKDYGEDTDIGAVNRGYVSLTPLDLDICRPECMDALKECMHDVLRNI